VDKVNIYEEKGGEKIVIIKDVRFKGRTREEWDEVEELLKPIFIKGELVYELPSIEEIRSYCQKQVESLWDEVKRFENPHNYYVDLTQKLWDIKRQLLVSKRNKK
jgi:nicotinate phosphoribosyltransferase